MRALFANTSIKCNVEAQGAVGLLENSELQALFSNIASMAVDWRFYPFALGICVFLCAAMTWNWYALRVSAFVFSFSVWFAIAWGGIVATLAPYLRRDAARLSDPFVLGFLGLVSLTFALFAACAIIGLCLYLANRPIEPRSRTGILLGVALVSAHVLNALFVATGAVLSD